MTKSRNISTATEKQRRTQQQARDRDRGGSEATPIGTIFARPLSWLLLTGGLATLALTAALMVISYSPLPYVDHWAFLYQWTQHRTTMFGPATRTASAWEILWALHGEHRILIPKLLVLADLYGFGGTNVFLFASIYVLWAIHAGILVSLAQRIAGGGWPYLASVFGVVTFLLFSPIQRENFTWAWQISNALPFVCATAAFAALARFGMNKRASRVPAASIAAACLGSFSLASGFLIWPFLLLEGMALRIQRSALVLIAAVGALAALLHFGSYVAPFRNAPGVRGTLAHPVEVFALFSRILVLGNWPAPWRWLAAGFGIAAIGLCVGGVASAMFTSRFHSQPFAVALHTTALYMAAAVMAASFGRWTFGFAGRYEAPALVFWATFALGLLTWAQRNRRLVVTLGLQLVVLAAMLGSTYEVPMLVLEARQQGERSRITEAAIKAGRAQDPTVAQSLYAAPQWVIDVVPVMAAHQWSVFHRPTHSKQ